MSSRENPCASIAEADVAMGIADAPPFPGGRY
jgi:hypothetical protein